MNMVMQHNVKSADIIILNVANNFTTLQQKWKWRDVMDFVPFP